MPPPGAFAVAAPSRGRRPSAVPLRTTMPTSAPTGALFATTATVVGIVDGSAGSTLPSSAGVTATASAGITPTATTAVTASSATATPAPNALIGRVISASARPSDSAPRTYVTWMMCWPSAAFAKRWKLFWKPSWASTSVPAWQSPDRRQRVRDPTVRVGACRARRVQLLQQRPGFVDEEAVESSEEHDLDHFAGLSPRTDRYYGSGRHADRRSTAQFAACSAVELSTAGVVRHALPATA